MTCFSRLVWHCQSWVHHHGPLNEILGSKSGSSCQWGRPSSSRQSTNGEKFWFNSDYLQAIYLWENKEVGTVGRTAASYIRGPGFASKHRQLLLNIYLHLTVEKTKIKWTQGRRMQTKFNSSQWSYLLLIYFGWIKKKYFQNYLPHGASMWKGNFYLLCTWIFFLMLKRKGSCR